jgi:ATP-dependent exoDNAse (exonuclease V) beta subunit
VADRLREGGVPYRAIEIQALAEKPVIQDLLALTRALLHLGDRVAWLAVLRAPWCGLTLADLHRIAGGNRELPVWTLLHDPALALDQDGARRLRRVLPALERGVALRGRVPVATLVERTWRAMGGDAQVEAGALADARAYFDLVEETGAAGEVDDFESLAERVRELFANPDADADGTLELMTIHKAKGLEFDTVILPGLGKPPKVDDAALLVWSERPASDGSDLLMAPIAARRNGGDSRIYDFIRRENDAKARYESQRLLYVACTRARSRLHLVGHVEAGMADGARVLHDPPPGALLAHIWGAVRPEFQAKLDAAKGVAGPAMGVGRTARPLKRVRLGLLAPEPMPTAEPAAGGRGSIQLSGDERRLLSRQVGTVVHRLLERIAREGVEAWGPERIAALGDRLRAVLGAEGAAPADLEPAFERVRAALERTLADPVGRWILGARDGARSEFAVAGVVDGEVRHLVIDRTFLAPDGVRWIVDFKTSEPEGGDTAGFLAAERRAYQDQLQRYAAVLAEMEGRTIRVGLYFPVTGDWVAWDPFAG